MERERIHHQGSQPLSGNDAYSVLGIVFDFIEQTEKKTPLMEPNMGNTDKLLDELRRAGYCCCVTEFGCAACGGRSAGNDQPHQDRFSR